MARSAIAFSQMSNNTLKDDDVNSCMPLGTGKQAAHEPGFRVVRHRVKHQIRDWRGWIPAPKPIEVILAECCCSSCPGRDSVQSETSERRSRQQFCASHKHYVAHLDATEVLAFRKEQVKLSQTYKSSPSDARVVPQLVEQPTRMSQIAGDPGKLWRLEFPG